jgi:hypothetical protein
MVRDEMRIPPTTIADGTLKALWVALDKDGSGLISAGEFGQVRRVRRIAIATREARSSRPAQRARWLPGRQRSSVAWWPPQQLTRRVPGGHRLGSTRRAMPVARVRAQFMRLAESRPVTLKERKAQLAQRAQMEAEQVKRDLQRVRLSQLEERKREYARRMAALAAQLETVRTGPQPLHASDGGGGGSGSGSGGVDGASGGSLSPPLPAIRASASTPSLNRAYWNPKLKTKVQAMTRVRSRAALPEQKKLPALPSSPSR